MFISWAECLPQCLQLTANRCKYLLWWAAILTCSSSMEPFDIIMTQGQFCYQYRELKPQTRFWTICKMIKSIMLYIVSILYCIPFLGDIIICQKNEKAYFVYTDVFKEYSISNVQGLNANPSKNYSKYNRTFALIAKISFPMPIVCFKISRCNKISYSWKYKIDAIRKLSPILTH